MKKIFAALSCSVLLLAIAFSLTASAAGTNLIANPSFETTTNGSTPDQWASNSWGTNTSKFTYLTTGHTGTKSVKTETTSYSSGDAKWAFTPVSVKPNTSYTFSDWYQSSVVSGIDVVVTTSSNTTSYTWLANPAVSSTWKQASYSFKTPANASKVTIYHYIEGIGQLTIDDASLTEDGVSTPPAAPTVSITAPTSGSTVSGTISLYANATDTIGLSNVQFKLDGINIGSADTTSPYSISWNSTTSANGSHSLTAVATNTSGISTTSLPISINVQNTVVTPPTPPVVSISSPTANSTVSGTINVTASATDAKGVSNVQFKLDGTNLAAADTTNPYGISWDTTTATNGQHILTAIATNTSNLSTTSVSVTITVNNPVVVPPTGNNLVGNPSVETASGSLPANWQNGAWGTNTRSMTYETNGYTGSRSLKAQITSYTNGDAKWFFNPVNVTGGKSYSYSNYYKSNIDTELDAMITLTDGSVQWLYLTSVPASPNAWQKTNATFSVPANAKTVSVFQVIDAVGYIQTDEYTLSEYVPAQFNRAIVSLTFDDGWRSIYTNGLPLLKKYNLPSTQYLLTNTISYPDYMTVAMMQEFKNQGSEIASHTVSHAHLNSLTTAQLTNELVTSQNSLRSWFGTTGVANNFATPYGEYNTTVVNEIKKYYRSHRSTDVGFNSKDSFNVYNIKVQNITNTTTPAQVQTWVNQAIAQKTWLVLVYHEVNASPSDPTYAVTPANLDQELNIIKQSGVSVQTVEQALNELLPQL